MRQLTEKEITSYLPYKINIQWVRQDDKQIIRSMLTISDYDFLIRRKQGQPILHPISDLYISIHHNGENFTPILKLLENVHSDFKESLKSDIANWKLKWDTLPYWVIQKLFEWHFDVFGLIPDNLAIDINKI